jgi:hypothetical protein
MTAFIGAAGAERPRSGRASGAGGPEMKVEGNKVTIGDYTVTAADEGQPGVTVQSGDEWFRITGTTGGFHVRTSGGAEHDIHGPGTFMLPNGARITVTPGIGGEMARVTVFSRNGAALITGFGDARFNPGGFNVQSLRGGAGIRRSTPQGTVVQVMPDHAGQLVVGRGSRAIRIGG